MAPGMLASFSFLFCLEHSNTLIQSEKSVMTKLSPLNILNAVGNETSGFWPHPPGCVSIGLLLLRTANQLLLGICLDYCIYKKPKGFEWMRRQDDSYHLGDQGSSLFIRWCPEHQNEWWHGFNIFSCLRAKIQQFECRAGKSQGNGNRHKF